jgi:hypothetical protein
MIGCSIWKLFFHLDQTHSVPILDNLKENPITIFVLCMSLLLILPISALLYVLLILSLPAIARMWKTDVLDGRTDGWAEDITCS